MNCSPLLSISIAMSISTQLDENQSKVKWTNSLVYKHPLIHTIYNSVSFFILPQSSQIMLMVSFHWMMTSLPLCHLRHLSETWPWSVLWGGVGSTTELHSWIPDMLQYISQRKGIEPQIWWQECNALTSHLSTLDSHLSTLN